MIYYTLHMLTFIYRTHFICLFYFYLPKVGSKTVVPQSCELGHHGRQGCIVSRQSQTVLCLIALHVVKKITFYYFNICFYHVISVILLRQASAHEVSARFKGFSHLCVLSKACTGGSKRCLVNKLPGRRRRGKLKLIGPFLFPFCQISQSNILTYSMYSCLNAFPIGQLT